MPRPRRLYVSDSGKYYYLKDKKRVYIKVPEGISNKQVQKINIANIIQQPTARRVKRRKKRKALNYEKGIIPGMKPLGGLPVHFFTPGKSIANMSEAQENKLMKDSVFNFDFMKTLKDFTDSRQKTIENQEQLPVIDPRAKKAFETYKGSYADQKKIINKLNKLYETIDNSKTDHHFNFSNVPDPDKPKRSYEKHPQVESVHSSVGNTPISIPRPTTPDNPFRRKSGVNLSTVNESRETPKSDVIRSTIPTFVTNVREVSKSSNSSILKGNPLPPISPKFSGFDISPGEKERAEARTADRIEREKEIKKAERKKALEESRRHGDGRDTLTGPPRNMKDSSTKVGRSIEPIDPITGFGEGDDGLYNDEIADILKHKTKNFVPVIPIDKISDLLSYVKPGQKWFSAVVNTNPSTSDGSGEDGYAPGHWRSIVVDNRDDFPAAEFFDPLARKAEPGLKKVISEICKKMNPEKLFLAKENMIQRQSKLSSSCGFHAIKFIEDRFDGKPWTQASGYDHYISKLGKADDSVDGEKEIQKLIPKYKKYL